LTTTVLPSNAEANEPIAWDDWEPRVPRSALSTLRARLGSSAAAQAKAGSSRRGCAGYPVPGIVTL
jgi:hypothetical protein